MAARSVTIDRDTPLLLPPDPRDWVSEDHLVDFILDTVAALDLRRVKVNEWGFMLFNQALTRSTPVVNIVSVIP